MNREQIRGWPIKSRVVNDQEIWEIEVETTAWELEELVKALGDLERRLGQDTTRAIILGPVRQDAVSGGCYLYNRNEQKDVEAINFDRHWGQGGLAGLGGIVVTKRQRDRVKILFGLMRIEDSEEFYQLVEMVLDDLGLSNEGEPGGDEQDQVSDSGDAQGRGRAIGLYETLTPVEKRVLEASAKNLEVNRSKIADELMISENTLKRHITHINQKLGMPGARRVRMINYARELGLID